MFLIQSRSKLPQ